MNSQIIDKFYIYMHAVDCKPIANCSFVVLIRINNGLNLCAVLITILWLLFDKSWFIWLQMRNLELFSSQAFHKLRLSSFNKMNYIDKSQQKKKTFLQNNNGKTYHLTFKFIYFVKIT